MIDAIYIFSGGDVVGGFFVCRCCCFCFVVGFVIYIGLLLFFFVVVENSLRVLYYALWQRCSPRNLCGWDGRAQWWKSEEMKRNPI